MFGYVTANMKELTRDQQNRYNAVYCGICRGIRAGASQAARLGLSFDIYNKGTDGQKRGMFMDDEFTHINGLPLPTAFSFSGNDFAIAMQDGKSINGSFGVSNGEVTSITIDGHTASVSGV